MGLSSLRLCLFSFSILWLLACGQPEIKPPPITTATTMTPILPTITPTITPTMTPVLDTPVADPVTTQPSVVSSRAASVEPSLIPFTPTPMASPTAGASDIFAIQRERMVVEDIEARGIFDPLVLAAMRAVPRHMFVPERYRNRAYDDTPLPIEEGSTISQPYIVALMSQLLDLEPGDKVLEVGTGSGYQAAVLAQMGMEVYSVEIIPALADHTRLVLDNSGYSQVKTLAADGYYGWEEHSPFDAIIVTAAPDHIPPPLLGQLKSSGNLVIPVGPPGDIQTLWLTQWRDGRWVSFNQGAVRFVPLLGR